MRKILGVEAGCGTRVDVRGVSSDPQSGEGQWQWSLPAGYERPHGEFYLEFGISSHQELVAALCSTDFSRAGQVMQACLLFGYIEKNPGLKTSSRSRPPAAT
jgi:hypothetical protein